MTERKVIRIVCGCKDITGVPYRFDLSLEARKAGRVIICTGCEQPPRAIYEDEETQNKARRTEGML